MVPPDLRKQDIRLGDVHTIVVVVAYGGTRSMPKLESLSQIDRSGEAQA
jgi:hypothetical protein